MDGQSARRSEIHSGAECQNAHDGEEFLAGGTGCDLASCGTVTLKVVSEKYRRLKAIIPGMVYIYALYPDGTHGFPYVSEASRDLFGLEPEDVMRDGTLLSGLIHPDDAVRRDESILRSAKTMQPWRQELRCIVHGVVRWYDCMSRPERQPDGTILWDGINLEITDRKRAEEAVDRRLALDETLRAISARCVRSGNADAAVDYSLAELGRLTQASRVTLCQVSGTGDLLDKRWQWHSQGIRVECDDLGVLPYLKGSWLTNRLDEVGFLHVRDVAKMPPLAQTERQFLEQRGISSFLILSLHIRGDLRGLIVLDNVTGMKEWSDYDLAGLRIAAELIGSALARSLTEEELRSSESLYRSLVAMSPTAITVTDLEGRILMSNPRALEIFGYTDVSESIGRNVLEWMPPEESDVASRAMADLLAKGLIKHAGLNPVRKNGQRFPADLSGSVVCGDDGKPRFLMIMTRDLTERSDVESRED
jgi:PAS domain S-box-containing protein